MTEANVLVINCGSSSLKLAVIAPSSAVVHFEALAERMGTPEAKLRTAAEPEFALGAHATAADVLEHLMPALQKLSVSAVGHRVVHGGEKFSDSTLLTPEAIAAIEHCVKLAPLHNPANLAGIRSALARFPGLPQVAVFDTAFHQTLPPKAYMYAVPYELYERQHVRRYGFHGTSHAFVAAEAARKLGKPLNELQLVTAHLGNGCSTCAIKGGQSMDTSMGLTPLEGLVMGTRSGDVDPNLHQYIAEHESLTLSEIGQLLNEKSGLLGLSGLSNDMRTLLLAAGSNARAQLAVDVFCYRLAKSILGACAALDRLDALVFTGGIGEHSPEVRARTFDQLRVLGATLDHEANGEHGANRNGRISASDSGVLALVVPTNEQLVIAREAARFLAVR